MQNNSQQNLLNRSLLRSHISDDEQVSMIRYEENKVELSSWLQWVLKILLILLFFVLLFSFWNSQTENGIWASTKNFVTAPFKWFSWSHQKQKPCEIIKYVKETDKDLEEFKRLQTIRKNLQLSGLSINRLLPQTPNLEYIKSNPHKYENITVMKQKILNENLPPKSQLDKIMNKFNTLIPYGNIYMESSPQQQQEIKQQLDHKIQKQEKLIKKMDTEFLENLQFNVQDFNESYKNFLVKREKIQNFRQQFQNIMKQLQQCQDVLQNKKNVYNTKNLELDSLQLQQNDLQKEINLQLSSLNDLQNALNDLISKKDNELRDIRQKVKQFQHYVDNEPQIRRQIEQAQKELEDLKNSQPNLMQQINDAINLKQQKQREYDNLQKKLRDMDLKNEILEDKIKIHEDELDAAYKNIKLQKYILTLLNKDKKISYLATLMQKKVQQEKDLLQNVEKFKKRMNEIEGELIVDIKKGIEVEEIIKAIEQDKQDFKNISSSYQELLKKINEVKDENAQIHRLTILIKKAKDERDQFRVQYGGFKQNLDKLKNDNIQLELKIKSLEDRYDNNKKTIEYQEKDIQQKIENLQLALAQYKQIKAQLNARELFYQDKINSQNFLIKDLQDKMSKLRKKISNILAQIDNIKPEVDILKRNYEQQEKDCSAYIQYFYETERFVKKLEDIESNDKQILQKLKQKIMNSLSVINDDINQ